MLKFMGLRRYRSQGHSLFFLFLVFLPECQCFFGRTGFIFSEDPGVTGDDFFFTGVDDVLGGEEFFFFGHGDQETEIEEDVADFFFHFTPVSFFDFREDFFGFFDDHRRNVFHGLIAIPRAVFAEAFGDF
ncbi:MAG: hypothetical protein P1V18_05035 [Candidatus Gracilibacteria bacterium]|nr:hypothetical protein [Candidatus Gracilibacteria bacterium]